MNSKDLEALEGFSNLQWPFPKCSLFSSAPCLDFLYPQNLEATEGKKNEYRELYTLTAGGKRIKCFSSTIKCLFESLMIFTFSVPYRGMLCSQGI